MNAPRALPTWQRPGRVGRHELDVDRPGRGRLDLPPCVRLGEDAVHHRLERGRLDADVEEAGWRHLDGLDRRRRRRASRRARASPPAAWRSPSAPCGTAGRASSPGSSRGRRDPGSPGARPRRRVQTRRRPARGTPPSSTCPARRKRRGPACVWAGGSRAGRTSGWTGRSLGRRPSYRCGSWVVRPGVREDPSLQARNAIRSCWAVDEGAVRSRLARGTRPARTRM